MQDKLCCTTTVYEALENESSAVPHPAPLLVGVVWLQLFRITQHKEDDPSYVVIDTPKVVHKVTGVQRVSDTHLRVSVLKDEQGLYLVASDAADGQAWFDALERACVWDVASSAQTVMLISVTHTIKYHPLETIDLCVVENWYISCLLTGSGERDVSERWGDAIMGRRGGVDKVRREQPLAGV